MMELLVLLIAAAVIALDIYRHGGFRYDGRYDEIPDHTHRNLFLSGGGAFVASLSGGALGLQTMIVTRTFDPLGNTLLCLATAAVGFAVSRHYYKKMRFKDSLVHSAHLHASAIPLAPGSEVKLTLTRELKQHVDLGDVQAELVLLQQVSRGFGRNKTTWWEPVLSQPLARGHARVKHGRIVASWNVPVTAFDPRKGHFFGSLMSSQKFYWELRAATPITGLADLNSVFQIPFMFPLRQLGAVATAVVPAARLEQPKLNP